MKILVVCDRLPFPLTNGQNLRIFHLCRHLARAHELHLVCLQEGEHADELDAIFRKIDSFPRPKVVPARGIRRLWEALSPEHFFVRVPNLRDYLRHVLIAENYDLVWGGGWALMPEIPRDCGVPVVADVIDDGVLEYWRDTRYAGSIREFFRNLKRLLVAWRFERRFFCTAVHSTVVSEIDERWLRRVCRHGNVSVIHNGVDAGYFSPSGNEEVGTTLVFEGNMGFRPNEDGICYFCKEIFPLVRSRCPEATLNIVGRDPSAAVLELDRLEGVHVTGFVDDVRPWLEQAAVFVCPLRKGAGIKNKVLQAWAMGKATVATPASVGGLSVEEGHNVLVRNEPRAFADAVVELLEHPETRQSLGMNARKTVLDRYEWRVKAQQLERIFQTASMLAPKS